MQKISEANKVAAKAFLEGEQWTKEQLDEIKNSGEDKIEFFTTDTSNGGRFVEIDNSERQHILLKQMHELVIRASDTTEPWIEEFDAMYRELRGYL